MRIFLTLLAAVIALPSVSAIAKDRPVTEAERPKLEAALKAAGCSVGKMEFDDDGKFEVDDSTCADGKKYDLTFDPAFVLLTKKLD